MFIDNSIIDEIKRSHEETDDSFVRQVRRAMNKLHYEGRSAANPLLASCAKVMFNESYDSRLPTAGCSSGRTQFLMVATQYFDGREHRRHYIPNDATRLRK